MCQKGVIAWEFFLIGRVLGKRNTGVTFYCFNSRVKPLFGCSKIWLHRKILFKRKQEFCNTCPSAPFFGYWLKALLIWEVSKIWNLLNWKRFVALIPVNNGTQWYFLSHFDNCLKSWISPTVHGVKLLSYPIPIYCVATLECTLDNQGVLTPFMIISKCRSWRSSTCFHSFTNYTCLVCLFRSYFWLRHSCILKHTCSHVCYIGR